MKRPAFQFYGGDWLREPGLRACSLAARGLWIDMISIMSQVEEPYGHLVFSAAKDGCKDGSKDGGKDTLRPILPGVLARMVGTDEAQVIELIDELESFGVFSRTPEGVIFSRRMVRDEEVRQSRASGGSNSSSNPNVPRKKEPNEDGARMGVRIPSDPSFDLSLGVSPSSSSIHTAADPSDRVSNDDLVEVYASYPTKIAKQAALKAIRSAISGIAKADGTCKREALSKLHSRVKAYAEIERRKGQDQRKFIPHPTTASAG